MIKKIALASMVLLSVAHAKDYGTVNGEIISGLDIEQTIGQSGIDYETLDDTMKKRVLDMVVDRKLLTQAAVKSDIEKSEEYATQLKSLKRDLALDMWMKKEMKTLEDGLSEEKLQQHYNDNKAEFSEPKKLQARHILVEKEEEAKALIKELDSAKDKKATFIELAKTKSTGPSGKNGGDLGWFELERMVPEFSAAADQLKVGDYTKEPVKTQFGFHLIMLDGKKEATAKPFKAVEAEIREELSGESFAAQMKIKTDALRKSAKIELK
ncbi:MAG: Peptidyl-prolyl cis-trans isomerase PpiD [uncultured Sulfurovum sp.]|uniref:Peptidyl-prolyl cis-trans isomerase PpiD n=1 Tax=uncultured Sulfurovum sp. TaxID=269237 RepID=A0A6S6TAY0_9BACT|nr:MAG: Peptidyl-prolyl cis-trans isomerase PpiD [uncultured Sulfurovum sp.]